MDCLEAIKSRRSCRNFKNQPVEPEKVRLLLEAAIYAPSPANKQPWEFIVTTNPKYNQELKEAADAVKPKLADRSGWKWLPVFDLKFLLQAPLLIIVTGDPSRNGAEQFLDEPSPGYLEATSTAIQNMQLAAHSLGLGALWFSLFEKSDVRRIFGISEDKDPVGVICIGYPEHGSAAPYRKGLDEKVHYLD